MLTGGHDSLCVYVCVRVCVAVNSVKPRNFIIIIIRTSAKFDPKS